MLKHTIFETKFGWIGIMVGDNGVLRTTLPLKSVLEVQNNLGNFLKKSIKDNCHKEIKIIQKQIILYLNLLRFLFARIMQAFGCCSAIVTAFAIVRDYFVDEQMAKIVAYISAVIIISPEDAPIFNNDDITTK